jgi:3-methyladenine DNA glycosylase AlkD
LQQSFTYTDYESYLQYLNSFAEEPFAEFQRRLIPGETILGVRTPRLRAIAKQIVKGDWRRFLSEARDGAMEEVMVQGLVIGGAKMEYAEAMERAEAFVPKIRSWATCDICGSSFRFLKKDMPSSFLFLKSYLSREDEFAVRFGVTLLMEYFISDEYVSRLFPLFDGVRHEGYYVKMALAWAVSMCYVKYPGLTAEYLRNCRLDDWTYNKALQKITESRRVDDATKERIRRRKRGPRSGQK